MSRSSHTRVKCPDCGEFKDTRGEYYFRCCGRSWTINLNKAEDSGRTSTLGESNEHTEHKKDSGTTGKPQLDRNLGETGPENSGGSKNQREPSGTKVEGETKQPKREKLELG